MPENPTTSGARDAPTTGDGSSADPASASAEREQGAASSSLDQAGQDALDRLEENAADPQSWGAPSSALHGLLRKLGAGLDDFLPSVSAPHSKLKAILAGLKADNDGRQLASLNELCELLSIGARASHAPPDVLRQAGTHVGEH